MEKINSFYKRICFLASLLILLIACEERINISTDDSPPRLVIYGYITTDTAQHAIRITKSAGYFSTSKPEGLSNATVSIAHNDEVYTLLESAEEQGLYLTAPDVYGITGDTYTLHVALRFDGEDIECEASSVIPPVFRLDSIAIAPASFMDSMLQVLIWGRLPEENDNFFSAHLFRNNVMLNDSLRNFSTLSDEYLLGKDLVALPTFMMNQKNERRKLSFGDTVGVQIRGITREYATFINNAQQEHFGTIPIFDGPPANVETNIHCNSTKTGISGFFTACSTGKRVDRIYTP